MKTTINDPLALARVPALLPCPFCGHAPRIKAGKVKCINKQCRVRPKIVAWNAADYDQNAIEDWNRREQTVWTARYADRAEKMERVVRMVIKDADTPEGLFYPDLVKAAREAIADSHDDTLATEAYLFDGPQ